MLVEITNFINIKKTKDAIHFKARADRRLSKYCQSEFHASNILKLFPLGNNPSDLFQSQ